MAYLKPFFDYLEYNGIHYTSVTSQILKHWLLYSHRFWRNLNAPANQKTRFEPSDMYTDFPNPTSSWEYKSDEAKRTSLEVIRFYEAQVESKL